MNYLDDVIAPRARRLQNICQNVNLELVAEAPLMRAYRLWPHQFTALRNYVNIYLFDSLTQGHQSSKTDHGGYALCADPLVRYGDQIGALPNITPNGLLLPKQRTWLSYNLVHRAVADIVGSLDLQDVAKMHSPLNIRIVNGRPNQAADARPRASTKLHTDIYAGELTHSMLIILPVMGDMTKNGIELYEPGPNFYPDFVRPLSNYDDAGHLIHDAVKYDHVMQAGCIYFLDGFLLHRTLKGTPGLRLALGGRLVPEMLVNSDLPIETSRTDDYIKTQEWLEYGTDRLLVSRNPYRQFTAAETQKVQNAYADTYDTVVVGH